MARRRSFNIISMSFLDAMTCGFGAVILFFMIISANVDVRSDEVLEDRSAEARRLELQVDVGRRNLAELREALATMLASMAETEAARDRIAVEIQRTQEELKELLEDADASEEMIEELEADLAKLEDEAESLAAESRTVEQTGNFIRQIRGEGYRQYLTGLRMGGERIVILVDVSRSMLAHNLPNIVLRSFGSDEEKLRSRKWRQVVDTVDWLTAQIPPESQFQIIAFNRDAWFVLEDSEGEWITATDGSKLTAAVETLRQTVPGSCAPGTDYEDPDTCGATSLQLAFRAMKQLVPQPDNIFLLVDGLPTMGLSYPANAGATGRDRMRNFEGAFRELTRGVPVNVLLYALEGDPLSAPAYWQLALATGGSLLAPSEDWP